MKPPRQHAGEPRRKPSQDRSRETVRAILEASAQVFDAHGYAGATTDRIAERAGVSVGSIYQYFGSKDAILLALAEQHVEAASADADALLATADPRDAIRALVTFCARLHAHGQNLCRLLFDDMALPPELHARTDAILNRVTRRYAELLHEAPGVAGRHPEASAYLVVQLAIRVVHEFMLRPPAGIPREVLEAELVLLVERYVR